MTVIIGEASRRQGHYVGSSGATLLREAILTEAHAHAYFAAIRAKPRNRLLVSIQFLPRP